MIDKFINTLARIRGWNDAAKRHKDEELRKILRDLNELTSTQIAIAVGIIIIPPLLGIVFVIRFIYVTYYNLM